MLRITRPRLLARLPEQASGESSTPGFTLLLAPLGYGKSVLLTQWRAQHEHELADRILHLRCSRDGGSGFWQTLSSRLAAALGVENPLPDSPLEATRTLTADLSTPFTLIIDDYHYATDAQHDQELAELALISPLLNLIVIARRVRILDGPLITGRAEVTIIGAAELAFTAAESTELIEAFGITDSPGLSLAVERAAGWPLAIRTAIGPRPKSPGPSVTSHLAELDMFAMHNLEVVSDDARRVLLATSLVDAASLDTIASFTGVEVRAARSAAHELLERGLLTSSSSGTTEFACHRAVQPALSARAERSFDADLRAELALARATSIESTDPFTAFILLCRLKEYARAETLLGIHFTTITDEAEAALHSLRAIPADSLSEYPVLAAARYFLEIPDQRTPSSTLDNLLTLVDTGVARRLTGYPNTQSGSAPSVADDVPAPLHTPTLAMAMWTARRKGDLRAASQLAQHLELRVTEQAGAEPRDQLLGQTSTLPGLAALPVYYQELALTAIATGDLIAARRSWNGLRAYAQRLIDGGQSGFGSGLTRSVNDLESGRRWLAAALSGLAVTEFHDGRLHDSARLLQEFDECCAIGGDPVSGGISIEAEILRACLASHLPSASATTTRAGTMHLAGTGSEFSTGTVYRVELWPLIVLAQTEAVRYTLGTENALAPLEERIDSIIAAGRHDTAIGLSRLAEYHARLAIVTSNFPTADRLLAAEPNTPGIQLEQARRALYAGDDNAAIVLTEQLRSHEITERQRVDRMLLGAIAAWNRGRADEAFDSFTAAAGLISECGLEAALSSVPYDPLLELAEAARDAGVCDLVAAVIAVPTQVRSQRYRQLTPMEQRTLEAVAEHRNISATASALFISPGTVKKHLRAIYRKLRVNQREDALLQAARMGLLPDARTNPSTGG